MLITIIWLNFLYILMPGIVAPSLPSDCDKPSMSGFNFMKEIKLTQGQVALVSDEDYESLNRFKWCAEKRSNTFYARRDDWSNGTRRRTYMHREVLGITDPMVLCDHKNGDGLHNYRNNLRIATASQNASNKLIDGNGTSKYKGVYWASWANKWRSEIGSNGSRKKIGYFNSEIEAAKAYNEWAIKLHGDFANLNIIEQELIVTV